MVYTYDVLVPSNANANCMNAYRHFSTESTMLSRTCYICVYYTWISMSFLNKYTYDAMAACGGMTFHKSTKYEEEEIGHRWDDVRWVLLSSLSRFLSSLSNNGIGMASSAASTNSHLKPKCSYNTQSQLHIYYDKVSLRITLMFN